VKTFNHFFLALALLIVTIPDLFADDETREPPIKYNLDVDGKLYSLIGGEPLKITGTLTNPIVKIKAEPYREFTYGGISFVYPRHFTFEADLKDSDCKSWLLSGKSFILTYFLFSEKITLEEYAGSLIEAFGKENCTKSLTTIEFLGIKYNGIKLDLVLSGQKIIQEYFIIPSTEGSKMILFQDSLTETGAATKEAIETLALLKLKLPVKENKDVKPNTGK
jgi:hypothetical protein